MGSDVDVVAFFMPQIADKPLTHYLTSVDCIEHHTGLDFLSELPDEVEERIEREQTRMWQRL